MFPMYTWNRNIFQSKQVFERNAEKQYQIRPLRKIAPEVVLRGNPFSFILIIYFLFFQKALKSIKKHARKIPRTLLALGFSVSAS